MPVSKWYQAVTDVPRRDQHPRAAAELQNDEKNHQRAQKRGLKKEY